MKATFSGGGSLDGLTLELPAAATSVVTTEGRCFYVLDDTTGTAWFTGFSEQGREMGKIMQAFTEAGRAEREAIEAATKPAGCPRCGSTFGSSGAYLVHFEAGPGSRCLPGDARGQLVEIDGVWCTRGSDAARR